MRASSWLPLTGALVCFLAASAPSRAVPLVLPGGVIMDVKAPQPVADDGDDAGEERSWFDYLKASIMFDDIETTEEVEDNKIPAWILGAMFNGYGGHIWAPMIFYKDVPSGPARTAALILGAVGVALNYAMICFIPFIYIPILGWMVVIAGWACILAMNWFFLPRAITFAYSDAYRSGGAEEEPKPKKKAKKKKKRVVEDDEE